ncbi:exocyst complex component 7 [Eurytemora carolleeae]|uniref:exocyst complex component 7 n=1 Tax=Eurytemora carolleeae TaxID=1294199 RepID=UPI000C7769E3|nr:exocyst complex component 7 [Eurytemora carolleeae]|eukprot:XP_023338791.1 exocyst complex component 7-like [Eurytemora affinis]
MMLFHVLRHMNALKPQFDKTLEGSDPGVRNKYNSLHYGLHTAGSMALDGFVEGIRTDGTTRERMPKDGTVFQLTANIMRYVENLIDYMDTIADILGQDASYNQAIIKLPRRVIPADRPQALLGLYIKKVLVQLNLTLVNKSETYTDPFLKAVFRLNNNVHILRTIMGSGLLEVVSLSAPECRENYEEMITEQKRVYSQCWETILEFIWSADTDIPTPILMAPGKLADKYCKIIKDKFSGFNHEIEEITATQKRYSIPDVELRESLKRDNKEYILPKYNSFYDKYVNVPFTKNTDKYIKYTPAQVSGLIDSFFDVAA